MRYRKWSGVATAEFVFQHRSSGFAVKIRRYLLLFGKVVHNGRYILYTISSIT